MHLLLSQGLKLRQDCQDKLSSCNDDLEESHTSMSAILKNLNCAYAHQVGNKINVIDS